MGFRPIIEWNLNALQNRINEKLPEVLEVVGAFVEGKVIQKIDSLGLVDEGNLKGSINHRVEGNHVLIGTNVEYAVYLELGTGQYAENGKGRKDGWYFATDKLLKKLTPLRKLKNGKYLYFTKGMHPHPFLRPIVFENSEAILKLFEHALD